MSGCFAGRDATSGKEIYLLTREDPSLTLLVMCVANVASSLPATAAPPSGRNRIAHASTPRRLAAGKRKYMSNF